MKTQDKAEQMIIDGLLKPHPKSGRPVYYVAANKPIQYSSNWMDLQEAGHNWNFPYGEKNLKLLKRLIQMHPKQQNLMVMDFFAGSGSTGHAVLELNAEDHANRRFILCTSNEGNIASEVCYPRLAKVIRGYRRASGKWVEGVGGHFRYFQ